MAGKEKAVAKKVSGPDQVREHLASLEHPLKAEIEALRALILGADPRIRESVKWNAPSFSVTEHFCTFKLRPAATVQLVFHTGAKVKDNTSPIKIDDPEGLLKWAATDRCVATFTSMADVESKQGALVAIVKQWIEQM